MTFRSVWFYRLLLNLLMVVSVFFLPWWMAFIGALGLLLLCEAWEVMLWGVLFDLLYSAPVPFYGNIPILFTLFFTTLFFVLGISKRWFIFY